MKCVRSLVLSFCMAISSWAISATAYDFSFTTENGISVNNGQVSLNDAGALVSGSGYLNGGGIVTSGTMSSFTLVNQPSPWQFTFLVGGITYYANYAASQFIGGAWYNGSLSYSPSVGTNITSGFTGSVAPTVSADPVPEIDGDKLPQAALLIAAMFLLFRNRLGRPSRPALQNL